MNGIWLYEVSLLPVLCPGNTDRWFKALTPVHPTYRLDVPMDTLSRFRSSSYLLVCFQLQEASHRHTRKGAYFLKRELPNCTMADAVFFITLNLWLRSLSRLTPNKRFPNHTSRRVNPEINVTIMYGQPTVFFRVRKLDDFWEWNFRFAFQRSHFPDFLTSFQQ